MVADSPRWAAADGRQRMSDVIVDGLPGRQNPHIVAVVDGRRYPVYEREFFIRPRRVATYESARGGPYRYCYLDPQRGVQVSFPLPYTPEIDALHRAGL